MAAGRCSAGTVVVCSSRRPTLIGTSGERPGMPACMHAHAVCMHAAMRGIWIAVQSQTGGCWCHSHWGACVRRAQACMRAHGCFPPAVHSKSRVPVRVCAPAARHRTVPAIWSKPSSLYAAGCLGCVACRGAVPRWVERWEVAPTQCFQHQRVVCLQVPSSICVASGQRMAAAHTEVSGLWLSRLNSHDGRKGTPGGVDQVTCAVGPSLQRRAA